MNKWYWLYSMDVNASRHRLFIDLKQHIITIMWFFLLYLGMLWVLSIDAPYIAGKNIVSVFDFYSMILFLFLFLNIAWIKNHLVDNEEILVNTPIVDHKSIIFEKLFFSTLNNIILYEASMAIYLLFSAYTKTYFIPNIIMYISISAIIVSSAPLALISLSLSKHIKNKYLPYIGITLVFFITSLYFFSYVLLAISLTIECISLWLLTIYGFDDVPVANIVKHYTSKSITELPLFYIFKRNSKIKAAIDFAWFTLVRKNEHISVLISSAIILVGMVIFLHFNSFGNSLFFYPFTLYKKQVIIAGTIYLGAAVFSTFDGLWLLSREGHTLWQLFTVTEPFYIMAAKTYVMLFLAIFYIPFVVVPLSIIIFKNLFDVLFWSLAALSLIFILASLGIIASVKYLNQSLYRGGNFPITTLYNLFFFSLIISVIVEGSEFYVFLHNPIGGILYSIFVLEWGILLVIDSIYWNNFKLNKMDLII